MEKVTLLEQFLGLSMEEITKGNSTSKRNFLEYAALYQYATDTHYDARHEFRRLIAIAAYLNEERVQPHLRPVAAGDKPLKRAQMEKYNLRNGDEYLTYRAFFYKLVGYTYTRRCIRTYPTGHPALQSERGANWTDLPMAFPRISIPAIIRWAGNYTDFCSRNFYSKKC